jgi:hypothetical protein
MRDNFATYESYILMHFATSQADVSRVQHTT